MLKGMMILPVEGLKIICWINGGAAIGLLTFVGNLGKNGSNLDYSSIKSAIYYYCAGLAMAAFAFVVSYIVQLTYWRWLRQQPNTEAIDLPIGGKAKIYQFFVGLGIVLSLGAVAAFIVGSGIAASALQ